MNYFIINLNDEIIINYFIDMGKSKSVRINNQIFMNNINNL